MSFVMNLTKMLITRIDDYLNAISEGLLVYEQGVTDYLKDNLAQFEDRLKQIDTFESRADTLRREIENYLYSHSLIPEMRGDVLGLLEHLDNIIDAGKESLMQFSVEAPDIPTELTDDHLALVSMCNRSAEAVVAASRAFFVELSRVQDSIHKVYFFEKEADRISDRLKRRIFRMDMDLSRKTHLRDIVDNIDWISDSAEDVADRLSIYAIKRSL